tara:strand:- start:1736 stop:2251 length:516 start_codon:yes stop_codon:yes gene_type:complete
MEVKKLNRTLCVGTQIVLTIKYTTSSHDERDEFAKFMSMVDTTSNLPTAVGLGATPMECDASVDFTTTSRTREQLRESYAPSLPPPPVTSNDGIQIEFSWIVLSAVSGVLTAIASYVFVFRPIFSIGKYGTYPKTTAYKTIPRYVRTLGKGTYPKAHKVVPPAQYKVSLMR